MKLGPPLVNVDEVSHRQVNPKFVVDGRVTSQVFHPTEKDKGLLSVNRGSMRTAEDSHHVFVARGWASWGTLSVSVGEAKDIELPTLEAPLCVADDPEDLVDDDTHAVVDFRALDNNRKSIEKKARKLKEHALKRGAVQPTTPSVASDHILSVVAALEDIPAMMAAERPASPKQLSLPKAPVTDDDT